MFRLEADTPAGFTRAGLARAIAATYQRIYQEEEERSDVSVDRAAPRLLNRNCTEGKYSIWGHDLEDLSLAYVYTPRENEMNCHPNYYSLDVNS